MNADHHQFVFKVARSFFELFAVRIELRVYLKRPYLTMDYFLRECLELQGYTFDTIKIISTSFGGCQIP